MLNTHTPYVALHEVTWCKVLWCMHHLHQDGSSFMPHQPCQGCKYTTSADIQKNALKKDSHSCRITCKRSESAQESGEQCYICDHQSKTSHTQSTLVPSQAQITAIPGWPSVNASSCAQPINSHQFKQTLWKLTKLTDLDPQNVQHSLQRQLLKVEAVTLIKVRAHCLWVVVDNHLKNMQCTVVTT